MVHDCSLWASSYPQCSKLSGILPVPVGRVRWKVKQPLLCVCGADFDIYYRHCLDVGPLAYNCSVKWWALRHGEITSSNGGSTTDCMIIGERAVPRGSATPENAGPSSQAPFRWAPTVWDFVLSGVGDWKCWQELQSPCMQFSSCNIHHVSLMKCLSSMKSISTKVRVTTEHTG
jgi:hypothetical protein